MNLTPHEKKNDDIDLRIEQVVKKKHEYHLIGSERRIKGHTLFSFNVVAREIKPAPIETKCLLGLDGRVIYENRVTTEDGCFYIQALNLKNAKKKLIRLGYNI